MFRKYDLNIVGLVENMSYFMCGHTDEPIEIFGHGGGEKLSKELDLPLLGSVPIDLELSAGGDSGVPMMVSAPDSEIGRTFQAIGQNVLAETPPN